MKQVSILSLELIYFVSKFSDVFFSFVCMCVCVCVCVCVRQAIIYYAFFLVNQTTLINTSLNTSVYTLFFYYSLVTQLFFFYIFKVLGPVHNSCIFKFDFFFSFTSLL